MVLTFLKNVQKKKQKEEEEKAKEKEEEEREGGKRGRIRNRDST